MQRSTLLILNSTDSSIWNAVTHWVFENDVPYYTFFKVAVPLGIPEEGRCIGFDPNTSVIIIAADCSVMFSYDGNSFRESTTAQSLCPGDLASGSMAILKTTCAHALTYEFLARGGSRVCVASVLNLCLHVTSYSPGNVLEFADGSEKLFTMIYKGTFIIRCRSYTHGDLLDMI